MDLSHVQPFIPLATAIVAFSTALVPYLFKKSDDLASALATLLLKKSAN